MKCRARSKVFKDQPTSGQRKALENQCLKEFDILTENFEHDANVKLLYLFHTKYGYGKKRLKRLSKSLLRCWRMGTPILRIYLYD